MSNVECNRDVKDQEAYKGVLGTLAVGAAVFAGHKGAKYYKKAKTGIKKKILKNRAKKAAKNGISNVDDATKHVLNSGGPEQLKLNSGGPDPEQLRLTAGASDSNVVVDDATATFNNANSTADEFDPNSSTSSTANFNNNSSIPNGGPEGSFRQRGWSRKNDGGASMV